MTYRRIKYLPAVRKIPDKLWNEIRLVLPAEKSNNTIGRPVIPYRKVLDGILYVLITGYQWKMLPKEYGSGFTTCHRRFQEWVLSNVFQKLWVRLLKLYDDLRGIKWTWQSLDSISVKAPLGGMTGWSKSYRTTKRHVLVDQKGIPLSVSYYYRRKYT